MKNPTFHFSLYCRGTLVDTFVTDCRQDFEEVVTYARAVRERGIQERRPITMDMLPDLKSALLATILSSRPRPSEIKMECMPRTFVMIGPCDMTLMQWLYELWIADLHLMDELVLIPNYLDLQCYSTPLWLKHMHTATYCDSTSDVASELLRTVFLFHIWEESW